MRGYTLIKEDVLNESIKLNSTERRIACYIMRWSWGEYDEYNNRHEWTGPITVTQIAKDIEMSRSLCSRTINKMIRDNKIFREEKQY